MAQISVLIPIKDRWPLLCERALPSVEAQTFQDFEILVIDDGSSEPPPPALSKNSRVKVLKSQGCGVSAARNTGLRASTAPFIALLDSDDAWASDKLLKQIKFLEEHREIPLVHSEEIWIRNGVRVNPMKKHRKSGGRIFERSTELCVISPSATMLRRSLLEGVGAFNEDFPVCEDYELWLRITSRFEVGFINEPLTLKFGGHEDQLSRKYHSMDLWRLRALKDHLENPHLSEAERLKVRAEILKKGRVLLKGFEKHQNFTHQNEVEELCLRAEVDQILCPDPTTS